MKKRKFYFILVILIIISLFSFAAVCTQFGAATEDKVDTGEDEALTDNEEEEETATEDETEETGDGEVEDMTGDEEVEETSVGEGEAPTISLSIYQGATYSEDDDVCYYRIEAEVTGSPVSAVSWSKDDSMGSFGNKKARSIWAGERHIRLLQQPPIQKVLLQIPLILAGGVMNLNLSRNR